MLPAPPHHGHDLEGRDRRRGQTPKTPAAQPRHVDDALHVAQDDDGHQRGGDVGRPPGREAQRREDQEIQARSEKAVRHSIRVGEGSVGHRFAALAKRRAREMPDLSNLIGADVRHRNGAKQ